MDKKKLRNDLILIGVCLFVSLAVWIAVTLMKEEGAFAVVKIDGKEWARYSLLDNREVDIETQNGKNILVIKDGYADITEADCPDGLCENQHRISKTGESLVCLPHKLTVVIEGAEEEGVDLIG